MCEQLKKLETDAARVLRELRKIRRSKDISFLEDAELNREKHQRVHAVLKHLLVGHEGLPCPSGSRPIVKPAGALALRH
jgi:hypothetical protein